VLNLRDRSISGKIFEFSILELLTEVTEFNYQPGTGSSGSWRRFLGRCGFLYRLANLTTSGSKIMCIYKIALHMKTHAFFYNYFVQLFCTTRKSPSYLKKRRLCSFVQYNKMYIVGGGYFSNYSTQISTVGEYQLRLVGHLPSIFRNGACNNYNKPDGTQEALLCFGYDDMSACVRY